MSNSMFLKSGIRNSFLKIVAGVFLLLTLLVFSKAYGVYGGSEFQVNTYTAGDQSFPYVDSFSDGSFVVVWDSYQDTSMRGVYAQLFDSQGSKIGVEIPINTYTNNDQQEPRVAVLSDSRFVVVWSSYTQDGFGHGVYAQIFDSSGSKIGSEFKVNDHTLNHQYQAHVIALENSQFLVTWDSQYQDGSDYGVYAKIFDSSGTEIVGEFQVNTYTTDEQRDARSALLSNGNFVVTWRSQGQDTSDLGVYGRIFNSSGAEVVEEFLINTYTTGKQTRSSATAFTNGTFVVVWDSENQDGDGWGIYGQIFNNDGTKVGGEFLVNTNTADHQLYQTIAGLEDDRFIVVWINFTDAGLPPGTGYSISAQIFDALGNKLGEPFQVNAFSTSFQYYPSAVKLVNGNFVIVWPSLNQDGDSWGIFGRMFSVCPASSPLCAIGSDQILQYFKDTSSNLEPITVFSPNPNVNATMTFSNSTAGSLNEWSFANATSTFDSNLGRWQASGSLSGINKLFGNLTFIPTVGYNDDFDIDLFIEDGTYNITDVINVINLPRNPVVTTTPTTLDYNCNEVAIEDGVVVTDADDDNLQSARVKMLGDIDLTSDLLSFANQGGITGSYNGTTGELLLTGDASVANYQNALRSVLYKNNGIIFPEKSLQISFLANDGTYDSNVAIRDINTGSVIKNCGPIYGGPEFQINTYTTGKQLSPVVTVLNNGNFVAVWPSEQDGSGYGVYGQILDTAGNKVGDEFQVNTNYTTNDQAPNSIATLNNGNFIVTWYSDGQDGSGIGTYGQIFGETGTKVGNEFQVNTYTTYYQYRSSITVLNNNNFVVVWEGEGAGDSYGIYGQLFNENGTKVGSEFQVNTYTSNNQILAHAVTLNNGNFVVCWQSMGQDGSNYGVYGQIFSEGGTKVGSEFSVNTYTTNDQGGASITVLNNNNFVIVWRGEGVGDSPYGVYGQIFSETGTKVGGDFLVNTYTTNNQSYNSVAALKNGGFVVIWLSEGQDGDDGGIYGQLFSENGAKVGSEFQVNIYTAGRQEPGYGSHPIATLNNGNFVVTVTG